MDNIKISIIMPVYNGEKYLDESIQSIVNQTFTNFELIIINDSSTDRSKDIAKIWAEKDCRINVIDNTRHPKGLFGALNTGLDNCNGDFIARADADDINKNYRLEQQIKFLSKHPSIDIVGAGYELFGLKQKRIFHPKNSLKIAWKFLTNTYFCHPTIMFRRSVLNTIKHYPPVVCEDFAFLSKVIQSHKGANIKNILLYYRQHDNNYSILRDSLIKESVNNTFKENYLFYTGSLDYADLFFNFHSKYNLQFKNILIISKISSIIIRKILAQYKIPGWSIKGVYIYFLLITDIIKSVFHYYFKLIFKKQS